MADSYSSHLMKIAPDGTISYDFDGSIFARGLDLLADDLRASDPQKKVRWTKLDGTVVSTIQTSEADGDDPSRSVRQAQLKTEGALPKTGRAQTIVQAIETIDANNTNDAALTALAHSSANDALSAVLARVNTKGVTLINGAGASSFLQLVAAGLIAVDFGNATVTWPGATPISSVVSVSHGLERIPAGIVFGAWSQYMVLRATGRSTTSISVAARMADGSSPAAGTTASFGWLVIG